MRTVTVASPFLLHSSKRIAFKCSIKCLYILIIRVTFIFIGNVLNAINCYFKDWHKLVKVTYKYMYNNQCLVRNYNKSYSTGTATVIVMQCASWLYKYILKTTAVFRCRITGCSDLAKRCANKYCKKQFSHEDTVLGNYLLIVDRNCRARWWWWWWRRRRRRRFVYRKLYCS